MEVDEEKVEDTTESATVLAAQPSFLTLNLPAHLRGQIIIVTNAIADGLAQESMSRESLVMSCTQLLVLATTKE